MDSSTPRSDAGEPVRVCHVVAGPLGGGAARGALWLHEGLQRAGCHSTLLTDYAGCPLPEGVVELPSPVHPRIEQHFRRAVEQLPLKAYPRRSQALFSTGLWGRSIHRVSAVRDADVVHLHWINGGMAALSSLRALSQPVVWTVRDLWPITGGCHYPSIHGCERYKDGCGQCPHLGSARGWDLSRYVYRRKARLLPSNLTFVGISEWVAECARMSPAVSGREVLCIPNCVDTDAFCPFERCAARRLLGLPQDRRIVLAGSLSPTEPYKGWGLLLDAWRQVKAESDLVLFGSVNHEQLAGIPRLGKSFGMVSDDLRLRVLYAAADVFVSPATAEAFGKTIAEALACGTPAVAFDATGPKDIVSHLHTGFLATPFESASLASGIDWVLAHPDHQALCRAARTSAEQRFSKHQAARAYLDLYARILGRKPTLPSPLSLS